MIAVVTPPRSLHTPRRWGAAGQIIAGWRWFAALAARREPEPTVSSRAELARMVQGGNGADPRLLLDQLYQAHARALLAYLAVRLPSLADAEDALADVFLKAVRLGDTGEVPDAGWLFTVARRAVADFYRERSRALAHEEMLASASKTAVFGFAQDDPAGHTALVRRDFTTPGAGWQRVTQMPAALMPPGGAAVLDVGPDGTIYAEETAGDGQDVTLRVYTLAPGASAFWLVWPQTTLTPPTRKFAFALGGIWPGGQPALYMDSFTGERRSRVLYRLTLDVATGS